MMTAQTVTPFRSAADLPPAADVAVVGGGLAGLAAAATAARVGRTVVLFEQAPTLGGRARTRQADGFSFNIGPHALYRGAPSLRVLADLGVSPRAATVGLGGAQMLHEGRLYPLPATPWSLLTSGLLGWRSKLEVAGFLGSLNRVDPTTLDGLTLDAWLATALRTERARQLVRASIRTASYANDAARLSAAAGLRQLQAGLTGALYVHGGWQTIVDDLRRRAEAFGARIIGGARVARVDLDDDGRVRGVALADGHRVRVSAVVLAVPPAKAAALVSDDRVPALAGWTARAVPVRAASLDVGLRRLPRPRAWFAVGLEEPLYLSVHSNWARLAPQGGALIHVLRYLGDEPRGDAATERQLEGLLDLVQPGWRSEVVARRFMPELTVAGALPSVAWEEREGPRGPVVPGARGLYVAGDWVGPVGMLADRALVSGAAAGRAAVDGVAAGVGVAAGPAASGNGVAAPVAGVLAGGRA